MKKILLILCLFITTICYSQIYRYNNITINNSIHKSNITVINSFHYITIKSENFNIKLEKIGRCYLESGYKIYPTYKKDVFYEVDFNKRYIKLYYQNDSIVITK